MNRNVAMNYYYRNFSMLAGQTLSEKENCRYIRILRVDPLQVSACEQLPVSLLGAFDRVLRRFVC